MQTLLIIFGISLIGILVMIYRGVSHIRRNGFEHEEDGVHPVAKNLNSLIKKIGIIFTYIMHVIAAFLSRIWARITHKVSNIYKKIVNKLEDYFKHKHENNINKDVKTQSILLTTIKAYKKEIKKLNQKIEPDQMRPKDNTKVE